ncbi:hypothetical protein KIPB_011070, partial [Kipferlia bialata]|eukprot:g11070.t1
MSAPSGASDMGPLRTHVTGLAGMFLGVDPALLGEALSDGKLHEYALSPTCPVLLVQADPAHPQDFRVQFGLEMTTALFS